VAAVPAKDMGNRLKSNNPFQENAKTEGKYIGVQFKVTNLTKVEERIIEHPKLVDGQGREFNVLDEAAFYIPEKAKTMQLEALPPSLQRTFWAIYEVPADASGFKFQVRTLGLFPDNALVALGF
jgi:hypothetical protein